MPGADDFCHTEHPRGHRIGLAVVAGAALLSAVAVCGLLLGFARNMRREMRATTGRRRDLEVFKTHVDGYFFNLLVFDLFQASGSLINIRWALIGQTHCGHACNTQGALKEIGETGAALTMIAIAVHTFFVIFFRWKPPQRPTRWLVAMGFIWTLVLTMIIACVTTLRRFYAPVPFWCWIGSDYNSLRLGSEYGWQWSAAFISLILYPLLYLNIRGHISVDPSNWLNIAFILRPHAPSNTTPSVLPPVLSVPTPLRVKVARSLLWYPMCYITLLLPLSIVRWRVFISGDPANAIASFATMALFCLCGVANVVLFMTTRPHLLMFNRRKGSTTESEELTSSTVSRPAFRLHDRSGSEPHAEHSNAGDLPLRKMAFASHEDEEDADDTYTKPTWTDLDRYQNSEPLGPPPSVPPPALPHPLRKELELNTPTGKR